MARYQICKRAWWSKAFIVFRREEMFSVQGIGIADARQVARVVELLQGKWTVQILCAMRERPVRLSQLRRLVPQASKKALTASLRWLEGAQMVVRRDLSSSVLHVEYELAEDMRDALIALFSYLADWAALLPQEPD